MDGRWGTFRVLREWILPVLRESFEDTLAASDGADLLVSHPLTYATRLVSEKTGIAWVSTVITPTCLFSATDPPLVPGFPGLCKTLRPLGPRFWGTLGGFLELGNPRVGPALVRIPSGTWSATRDRQSPGRWSLTIAGACPVLQALGR